MDIPFLAYLSSFIGMFLVVSSYFFKNKKLYLLFQFLAIIFLILSFFFSVEFVAMIGLIVGLFRTFVYFIYEKNDLTAPIIWPFIFAILTIGSYFLGSYLKTENKSFYDILYVLALILFACIFRIRNIKIVRYTCLIPLSLSVVYTILISAPIFNVLSYSFELTANVVSIVLYSKFINNFRKKIVEEK